MVEGEVMNICLQKHSTDCLPCRLKGMVKQTSELVTFSQSCAPMSLRGRLSPTFYTQRARIPTMFVKKNCKNLFSCLSAFFEFELYTRKNITVGFINIQQDSLTFNEKLQKNICQVKYTVFKDLTLSFFYIFHYINTLFGCIRNYY